MAKVKGEWRERERESVCMCMCVRRIARDARFAVTCDPYGNSPPTLHLLRRLSRCFIGLSRLGPEGFTNSHRVRLYVNPGLRVPPSENWLYVGLRSFYFLLISRRFYD